ncbi:helicase-related protein [Telmatospirillum sp. J64-1]|uniref:helicase-related protein n=1 Tax=Telmatospirillum sp. J64-1 TaxID=2502183 RepID=UPI00115E979E|nr:helicase-related protein [Telmatospirillum sp. J64-1]
MNTLRPTGAESGRVIAVLGPTNTGKTHLALERMLGHASGMIGFPLRLLARENYERIVRIKGPQAVALLTGEEKIVPPRPSYFVCTVESMPLDRRVSFLAVDEIQLCADPDRGHVFTDRLLYARGETETMFLGAETIKPLVRRLVPGVEFMSRPRFSQLEYSGPRKLTRLPPRSAVVAFSASDVYTMAELIRRQRGGAAVVLGALSPRTRNAQVGMYQAGEVDYLVATDAIGMGLNMDVDHVAFASLRKFDGRQPRDLNASEIGQIAGRAGRHMNDGTFGTTGDAGGIEPEIVEAVENHEFPALKGLFWRNPELRFASVEALLHSLGRPPQEPGLIRAREADDHLALAALARDAEILKVADKPNRVRLLWEVCQIPDFRKVMAENHTRLLGQIYRHLTSGSGFLPADWLDNHVKRLDRTDGDIETIIGRIANIRTWTFVSHRGDWVADPVHWQERTRTIEDHLSDALHERLTQRFVDRRTAVLVRRLKEGEELLSAVSKQGEVLVEGQFVGRLSGFHFVADRSESVSGTRAVAAAASRALKSEIAARARRLAAEPDEAFALTSEGILLWRDEPVARLAAGADLLRPVVEPLSVDLLDHAAREAVGQRLESWVAGAIRTQLRPLFRAREAELTGPARGLVFQMSEALGSLPRRPAEQQVSALSAEERKALARLDIRLGVESIFLPGMLKPNAQAMRALLWCVHRGIAPIEPPPPGRVSLQDARSWPVGFLEAVGFRPLGPMAVRVDMLERFAAEIRQRARQSPFAMPPELLSTIGLKAEDLPAVMEALGWREVKGEEGGILFESARKGPRGKKAHLPQKNRPEKGRRRERPRDPADSPFAKLRHLVSS